MTSDAILGFARMSVSRTGTVGNSAFGAGLAPLGRGRRGQLNRSDARECRKIATWRCQKKPNDETELSHGSARKVITWWCIA